MSSSSFWRGVASLLNIFGTNEPVVLPDDGAEVDAAAIESDWREVMGDWRGESATKDMPLGLKRETP